LERRIRATDELMNKGNPLDLRLWVADELYEMLTTLGFTSFVGEFTDEGGGAAAGGKV